MPCPETLRVQAYFDAEVDAVAAADIERHVEGCEECRAQFEELERARSALRRDLTDFRASPELRARIGQALDAESRAATARRRSSGRARWRVPQFWMGAVSGVGVSAVAAALVLLLVTPLLSNPLVDDLTSAHMRSLMPTHLIDVASTDKHTVKPWFAGHADVSPVVADFADQGYKLIGGRTDYLEHQRSAVVVYQHGAHVINVFSWVADNRHLPGSTSRDGYHLLFWQTGDLEYCAVSDTGWDELQALAQLMKNLSQHDRPG
jgi:anti-sigma factor RsiW